MSIELLKNQIGDHAKDIKLNLASVMTEAGSPELNAKQIHGIALACAYTTKIPSVIDAIAMAASSVLSESELLGAKSAASIMAMNNVYYRFAYSVSDKAYASMPAKLRMNIIGSPGMDKVDFELNCLAVSAMNGCAMCMEAHTQALTTAGLSKMAIQSSVRLAAVINATAMAL